MQYWKTYLLNQTCLREKKSLVLSFRNSKSCLIYSSTKVIFVDLDEMRVREMITSFDSWARIIIITLHFTGFKSLEELYYRTWLHRWLLCLWLHFMFVCHWSVSVIWKIWTWFWFYSYFICHPIWAKRLLLSFLIHWLWGLEIQTLPFYFTHVQWAKSDCRRKHWRPSCSKCCDCPGKILRLCIQTWQKIPKC